MAMDILHKKVKEVSYHIGDKMTMCRLALTVGYRLHVNEDALK